MIEFKQGVNMLTEEGSIKTENIPVAPALNEYRKKLKIISLISLILGTAGVIMYIVGSVIDMDEAPLWVNIFLLFAVPLALGLIGYITIARLKKREKEENGSSECLFFADCFFYTFKSAKIAVFTEQFVYSDAVLKRENERYGYIFVKSKGLFLVFSKAGLSAEELNSIRKNFGQPIDGVSAELKNHEKNN